VHAYNILAYLYAHYMEHKIFHALLDTVVLVSVTALEAVSNYNVRHAEKELFRIKVSDR
jgi:hypothetical protein